MNARCVCSRQSWSSHLIKIPQSWLTARPRYHYSPVFHSAACGKQTSQWSQSSRASSGRYKPHFRPTEEAAIEGFVPSGIYEAFGFQNQYDATDEHDEQPPAPSSRHSAVEPYAQNSIEELEQELMYTVQYPSENSRPLDILHHLIYERDIRPNTLHYTALFLINACPRKGSAANIKTILREMSEYNVPQSIETYRAVLNALAIHPDVETLHEVLERCRQQYVDLDNSMLHLVSLSYLRAGLFEIAMDYFEKLFVAGQIETWLYPVFLRSLADAGDWEAVMRMCYQLQDDQSLGAPLAMRQIDIPYSFWEWLLQKALAAKDISVSTWIWKGWVMKGYIVPDHKTCIRMMKMSAENNDFATLRSALKIWHVLYSENSDPILRSASHHTLPPNLRHLLRNLDQSSHLPSAAPYYTSFHLPPLPFQSTTTATHQTHISLYLAQKLLAPAHFDAYHALTPQTDPGAAYPRLRDHSRRHARWAAEHFPKHRQQVQQLNLNEHQPAKYLYNDTHTPQDKFEATLRKAETRRTRAARNPFEEMMRVARHVELSGKKDHRKQRP